MAPYGRNSFPPGSQWDPGKYDANLKKWKVPFELAAQIFQDPLLEEKLDSRFRYDEARFLAIGETHGVLLYVAFTLRGDDEDIVHIISARKAFPAERRAHAKVQP